MSSSVAAYTLLPSPAGVHGGPCPACHGRVPGLATQAQSRLTEGQSHGCREEAVWTMGGQRSDTTT